MCQEENKHEVRVARKDKSNPKVFFKDLGNKIHKENRTPGKPKVIPKFFVRWRKLNP